MPIDLSKIVRPKLDPRFSQPADTTCANLAEVGKVLRTRRKELGWSQVTAAEVCGFNQRMISQIETGARGVAFDRVALYASRLEVRIVLHIGGRHE